MKAVSARTLFAFIQLLAFPSVILAMDPIDCFEVGLFGVPQSDPHISKELAEIDKWKPVFMEVVNPGWDAEGCEYVTPGDVFRLVYTPADTLLLAGCSGDFNGDTETDYALLLQNPNSSSVSPFVFLGQQGGFKVIQIPHLFDPYGFEKDRTWPPGPFCIPKPQSGQFTFESDYGTTTFDAVGDLFVVGWETYAWGDTGLFVVHMAD